VHPVGSYCMDIARCPVNRTLKENKDFLKIIAELLSLVVFNYETSCTHEASDNQFN